MPIYVHNRKALPIALEIDGATIEEVRDLIVTWVRDGRVITLNFAEYGAFIINWSHLSGVMISPDNPNDLSEPPEGYDENDLPLFPMNFPRS